MFDTGYRHSDYSVTGKIGTHKFELQYSPTADLLFRGSFQRAIRAPSLIELFNPAADRPDRVRRMTPAPPARVPTVQRWLSV